MCKFIGFENIAANALIELFEKFGQRVVSFETLVRYGGKVALYIEENTGEKPILLFSRKYQYDLVESYSDYFSMDFDAPGQSTVTLRENVKIETLENNFRWSMSMNYVQAFLSNEAIQELEVCCE